MLTLFYSKIYSNINENVPLRTHRSHSFPSWFSSDLRNQINEKIWFYYLWAITGRQQDRFKRSRAICCKLSRQCYRNHLKIVQSNCKTNPKNFYKFINENNKPINTKQ